MKVAAIIPVKTFSKAKTRLCLSEDKTVELCKTMLDSVLESVSQSQINKIVLVSKDECALKIGKKYGVEQIFENTENGVNAAVALSEKYLLENDFEASIVLPQDIPLIRPQDISSLLGFHRNTRSLLVVPSRRFDGTNALLRSPVNVIETHYDEDSYKIHLSTGKSRNIPTYFVLISRIMWDVDDRQDIKFIMDNIEKPDLAKKIRDIVGI
ncbi:MAG TPA: 2-phospho-L-lactate guanylyltransferase [Candidatus Nitrosotenuis sp.]|nr:2-phospho-L-lactate guanylyltransferase [Candidatus Nitrosotenuis sp.]